MLATVAGLCTVPCRAMPRRSSSTPLLCPLPRDAIAKTLYSLLFSWLTDRINKLVYPRQEALSIAILDIYGFEVSRIHPGSIPPATSPGAAGSQAPRPLLLAGPQLQQLRATMHQLRQRVPAVLLQQDRLPGGAGGPASGAGLCPCAEHRRGAGGGGADRVPAPQEEYLREQIEWKEIPFSDNQPCIDLISQKPYGILRILDDQSCFPQVRGCLMPRRRGWQRWVVTVPRVSPCPGAAPHLGCPG